MGVEHRISVICCCALQSFMARGASLGRIKCKEHEETHKMTKGLCGIINVELSMNFIILTLS